MADRSEHVEWIAELFPPQGKWREADYFRLPETNRLIELVEGRLIMHPTPSFEHQEIVNELVALLREYGRATQVGKAISAPFDVRLWEDRIRQPDVLFIRAGHLDRVKGTYLDGPPDWVAEVISPSSREVDEVEKIRDYAEAGVPEYWLIDPQAKTIRIYALRGDAYTLVATYGIGQTARSVTLEGFTVPVDRLLSGG